MKRALTLWSERHLTMAKCQEEEERRMRKKKSTTVQDKVKAIPNKRGKETKSFATFSAGKWKNDTTTFLKSIESEIGKAEMAEIMEEARQVRSVAGGAHEEGPVVFETLDDVPDAMIIRNGHGEPESSDEEWVPTQVFNGNVIYPCLCMIHHSACHQVDSCLINRAPHRLMVMADQIFLTVLALHVLLIILLALCMFLTILAPHILLAIVALSVLTNFVLLSSTFNRFRIMTGDAALFLMLSVSVCLLNCTFVDDWRITGLFFPNN